jgi:hypothetical protein
MHGEPAVLGHDALSDVGRSEHPCSPEPINVSGLLGLGNIMFILDVQRPENAVSAVLGRWPVTDGEPECEEWIPGPVE